MMSADQLQCVQHCKSDDALMLAVGAVRSGKTYASTTAFFLYTQALEESFRHLLLGRKLRVIESELLPTMEKLADTMHLPYEYNVSRQQLQVGQQTYFLYAGNDERSASKIQGHTIHSAMMDEVTLVPREFFEMALSRLSYDMSKAWMTCNPAGPAHYVKADYIDPGRIDRVWQFGLDSNPTLGEKTKNRLRGLYTGVFHKRMIEGLWAAAEGLIYPVYQVVSRPDQTWKRVNARVGVDYGVASPSAFVLVEQWRKKAAIRWTVGAVEKTEGGQNKTALTDSELSKRLLAFARTHRAKTLILDPTASSLRTELLKSKDRRGITVRKARNDIIPGIRVTGNALANQTLTLNPGCEPLEKELLSYSWGPDERPVKHDDHACDALRYVALDMIGRYSTLGNVPLPRGM